MTQPRSSSSCASSVLSAREPRCVPTSRLSTQRAAWLGFCLLFTLSACIPARTPPQLDATPGAAVVVTERVYATAAFTAAYPSGWRAITSPAEADPFVIFAAPDACTLILVAVEPTAPPPVPDCDAPETVTRAEMIDLDGSTIYLTGRTRPERVDSFDSVFERVRDSVGT